MNFEGKGFIWATIYLVTRHFGGSEEGGWWYNRRDPHLTVRIVDVEEQREAVKQYFSGVIEQEGLDWGNIYHSTGGQMAQVFFESSPGEFETTESPRYE